MPARQEDFVFAERVLQHGYATEEQVQECLLLLDRLRGEMQIDESLANLMVKKGYLAPAQANVLDVEIDPSRAGRPTASRSGDSRRRPPQGWPCAVIPTSGRRSTAPRGRAPLRWP